MKMRLVLLLASLGAVAAGCSDQAPPEEEKQTTAEYLESQKEADRDMADAHVPELTLADGVPPDVEERLRQNVDLNSHPLSRFFVPEGADALDALGKFYWLCDPERPQAEEQCNERIELAIGWAARGGIRLTEADLRDPGFWAAHKRVYDLEKAALAEGRSQFPRFGNAEQNAAKLKWESDFRERKARLVDEICGGPCR